MSLPRNRPGSRKSCDVSQKPKNERFLDIPAASSFLVYNIAASPTIPSMKTSGFAARPDSLRRGAALV
ncbi:hypothetical protein SBV1_1020021 [Verrucomicrobia bacterium]|nr:hypothetical protein SBV1_1020021 [Verrucomicrobiota bacterium]